MSEKYIPEIAKNWEDAETNPEYWWNIEYGTCEKCFSSKRLSYSPKCWKCLTEEEKEDFKKLIISKCKKGNILKGLNLRSVNFGGEKLFSVNFDLVDFSYANFEGANLENANLCGSKFHLANFKITNLQSANLERADMSFTNLEEAMLRDTNLIGAIIKDANLKGAILSFANIKGTDLSYSRFGRYGLIVERTEIKEDEDLNKKNNLTKVAEIKYTRATEIVSIKYNPYTRFYIYPFAIFFWFLLYIFNKIIRNERTEKPNFIRYKKTILIGIDTSELNWSQHPQLIRDIHYQQLLYAFKERSWFHKYIMYPLWGMTSYFGESLSLWLLWASGIITGFALSFLYFEYARWLPKMLLNGKEIKTFTDAFYLSGLVFTSLGLGSFVPANDAAKWWILAEVMLGFIMLGSLVSFFANKFVRRD